MIQDIFSRLRPPRLRIRMSTGKAITVTSDPREDLSDETTLPAKEWSITDDVLNLSDSASFTVANDDGENSNKFSLGAKIEIDESDPDVANGAWTRHFTGRITAIEHSSDMSGGSVILVTAMDLGWHLTSSHRLNKKGRLIQLNGITLKALIESVIDPTWGFASTTTTDGNALNRTLKQGRAGVLRSFVPPKTILPFIQIEPGQSPFDVLRTYLTREGLLLNVGARGDLILFRPDYESESPYDGIVYHKSTESERSTNNVEGRPTKRETIDGVYSEVQCWSTVVKPTNVQETAQQNNPNSIYRNESFKPDQNPLPFNRLHIFSDSEAINEKMRKNRATWKWQMDYFNSWVYECDVQGHSQAGHFFVSDSMISINDTVNKVDGVHYVHSVRRSLTLREGIKTHLVLRKPRLLDPSLQTQLGGGAKKAAKPDNQPPAIVQTEGFGVLQ